MILSLLESDHSEVNALIIHGWQAHGWNWGRGLDNDRPITVTGCGSASVIVGQGAGLLFELASGLVYNPSRRSGYIGSLR